MFEYTVRPANRMIHLGRSAYVLAEDVVAVYPAEVFPDPTILLHGRVDDPDAVLAWVFLSGDRFLPAFDDAETIVRRLAGEG